MRVEAPIRLLHVDDDQLLTGLLNDLVVQSHDDISLHSMHDCDGVLSYLETNDVDCVISDYEMPGTNGLELLDAVRQRWPDLPFILFTGQGDEEIAEKAINAGVTDYVQKRSGALQFALLLNRVRKAVEQRRARAALERELRIEKEHFRMALENSPFVAFRLDTDLRYTWVGNPHEDFEVEQVLGKRDDELLPPEAAETVMEPKRRALETGERVREEVTYELPSGVVTYDLTVEPLRDESGAVVGLTCASLDVTDRKAYERQLERDSQRTEAQFELLVDTVEDYAIFLLDPDGRVQTWNRGAENIKGYAREEVVGEHVSVFYPEDDVAAGVPERNLREAKAEGHFRGEGWRVRKDGSTFWADVRLTAIREDGEFLGYAKVTRDSTEQKRERDLLERKEQLEDLISAISHDLRGPLSVAAGNVELARRTDDLSRLDATSQALERATELLDHLGRLAKEGTQILTPKPTDLCEVAETAWSLVETGGAELVVEGSLTVVADPSRLQQLFENLFANSVAHAGPDVTVWVGPLDERDGFYVEDDGPGVPETERAKVFEMGYSTDTDGTGFGLAICNQIADAHGWDIGVTEGRRGGARFEMSSVGVA
ncbi:hybrid sensor histidine kinase/response regulator [Salinigranum rubrum]|uniref:hybrid sensor histidine kinase/response regulator n=1 Tax=Salinigranum rubrum TaxID=755307 RepID=UPI0013A586E0|nr:PAS domain-containing protein [Salinigranum rubrum]